MAFNEQEQQIIDYGIKNKKSQMEVMKAIASYRSSIETPQPSPSLLGNFVGVGVGAVKSTVSTLQNIGNVVAKPVGKAMGIPESEIGIPEENLQLKGGAEKLGAFLSEVAQFAIPATKISKAAKGASIAKQIGGQVLSDVGVSVAQTNSLKDAGKTGLWSAGISSIPVLGKLIPNSFVNKIAGVSKNLEEINLRLTPAQKLQLEKTALEITDFLAKQKITGSPKQRYDKINTLVDGFENKIQNVLKTSGKNYSKQEIIDAVKNIPEIYLDDVANPEVYNEMIKRTDDFVNFINQQKGDLIPATRVNEFKRSYAKNARNKAGDQVLNDARAAISDGIYDLLQRDIKTLQPINKNYSKVLLSQRLLGKALGRNELGLIGNLLGIGVGSSLGASLGGGVGAAAGAVAGKQIGKVVAGTKTRSQIGAGLQKLTEYLQNPQIDNIGNIIIPKSVIDSIISD
jgi:hypothetical protein